MDWLPKWEGSWIFSCWLPTCLSSLAPPPGYSGGVCNCSHHLLPPPHTYTLNATNHYHTTYFCFFIIWCHYSVWMFTYLSYMNPLLYYNIHESRTDVLSCSLLYLQLAGQDLILLSVSPQGSDNKNRKGW